MGWEDGLSSRAKAEQNQSALGRRLMRSENGSRVSKKQMVAAGCGQVRRCFIYFYFRTSSHFRFLCLDPANSLLFSLARS